MPLTCTEIFTKWIFSKLPLSISNLLLDCDCRLLVRYYVIVTDDVDLYLVINSTTVKNKLVCVTEPLDLDLVIQLHI